MLKSTASSIASPLAKLFSCSILTGKFPTIWKIASIVPIPKSGHKNGPSNYRPISLLSIFSKLLEKIVYSRLWEDLVHGSSISECQWGFQKHKSTTTALLSTTQELFLCLCTFHSIVNGLVYLPNETFLPPAVTVTSRRNGNPHAYRVPHAHLNGLYFSFVCNTIRI